ncbi:MAG: DUF4143 domain-containing protein [Phascolarctobacterium sp.]|uniref:DUF4143 domain-containing protein n=1 Tax=Phascolarctobacterium sp. TaxID=2049039 RepID=UPI0026DCECF2|nr:DUF4143 domain-containing protein [Phascolarctobacterium sp.]MDO4921390.1 DUF4143 domain-containing protein [Phascolarctobacterium sp.]
MTHLQEAIRKLQLNNKLVILHACADSQQKELLDTLTRGYNLVDLSLAGVRMQAKQDAAAFVRSLPLPAYVANLHYMPSLLPHLLAGALPCTELIAGCCQNYYLQEAAAQAGGKLAFVELPWSAGAAVRSFVPPEEALARLTAADKHTEVLAAIVRGDLAGGSAAKAAFISRVLQQNIMEQTTVSDELRFFNFLCAAAGMVGSVVNYTTLANVVGVSAPTAKQWLQFLAGAGLIYFLHPVEELAGKRLLKAPKLYFKDTGLAAHLLQLQDTGSLIASLYFKALYENYVVNIVREGYLQQGIPPEILFYRDSNNKEISMLLFGDGKLYPVFISKDGISVRKLAKLFALLAPYAEKVGAVLGPGCMVTLGGTSQRLGDNLWQINAELL